MKSILHFQISFFSDIHCCEFASTGNCKEVCKKNLKKRASDVEIMNNLKSACGPILLHVCDILKSSMQNILFEKIETFSYHQTFFFFTFHLMFIFNLKTRF